MAVKALSLKGSDSKDVAMQAQQELAGFEAKLVLFFA